MKHFDDQEDSMGTLISSDGDGEQSVLTVLVSKMFRQKAMGTLVLVALLVGGALFWSNVRATEESPQVPDIAMSQTTTNARTLDSSQSNTPTRDAPSSEQLESETQNGTSAAPSTEVNTNQQGYQGAPTSSTYHEPGQQRRSSSTSTPTTTTPTTTTPQNILQDWWDSLGRSNRQADPSTQVPTTTPSR